MAVERAAQERERIGLRELVAELNNIIDRARYRRSERIAVERRLKSTIETFMDDLGCRELRLPGVRASLEIRKTAAGTPYPVLDMEIDERLETRALEKIEDMLSIVRHAKKLVEWADELAVWMSSEERELVEEARRRVDAFISRYCEAAEAEAPSAEQQAAEEAG